MEPENLNNGWKYLGRLPHLEWRSDLRPAKAEVLEYLLDFLFSLDKNEDASAPGSCCKWAGQFHISSHWSGMEFPVDVMALALLVATAIVGSF